MDKNHPERDPNAAVPDVKREPQTPGTKDEPATGVAGGDAAQQKPAGEGAGDHLIADANRSGAFPYEKSQ